MFILWRILCFMLIKLCFELFKKKKVRITSCNSERRSQKWEKVAIIFFYSVTETSLQWRPMLLYVCSNVFVYVIFFMYRFVCICVCSPVCNTSRLDFLDCNDLFVPVEGGSETESQYWSCGARDVHLQRPRGLLDWVWYEAKPEPERDRNRRYFIGNSEIRERRKPLTMCVHSGKTVKF